MGGLNASFIQGVQAPQIDNPITTAEGISRLEQIRQQNALAPLRAQQMQGQVQRTQLENQVTQGQLDREAEDKSAEPLIQQALADNGGDWAKARPTVESKISNRVLQKKDADHLQYVKALTETDANTRKAIIDKSNFFGRELNGIINTPEEERQAAWDGGLQRATEYGAIKPGDPSIPKVVPSVDSLKAMLAHSAYAETAATIADKKALEDKRRADEAKAAAAVAKQELQGRHEKAASDFEGIDNKADYDATVKRWLSSDDPEEVKFAKQYLQAVPYSDKAVRTIQRRAMTQEQRAQNDDKTSRTQNEIDKLALTGGLPAMILRSKDPTLDDATRKMYRDSANELETRTTRMTANAAAIQDRFNTREADTDAKTHRGLEQKSAEAWTMRSRLFSAIKQATDADPSATTVKDPKTNRDIPIDDARMLADKFRDDALRTQAEQEDIQRKHGWGKFAPGQPQPAAQPAPAAAPVTAPPRTAAPARTQGSPAAPAVNHQVGETRQYNGGNYKFDGKQWILQSNQ